MLTFFFSVFSMLVLSLKGNRNKKKKLHLWPMDLLQSNTVKFQQHLWKLQTNLMRGS